MSIFIGMALPALSAHMRPYLGVAVFLLLTLAFLRVDQNAIRHRLRHPGLLIGALVWMMLGAPLLTWFAIEAMGLDALGPDVILALFIATAAPPVMAAPCLHLPARPRRHAQPGAVCCRADRDAAHRAVDRRTDARPDPAAERWRTGAETGAAACRRPAGVGSFSASLPARNVSRAVPIISAA
ncbi:hypothetical protein QW131_13260 [Roseibium salinum]|nr:hypothetical protein [Roseibium salinum]